MPSSGLSCRGPPGCGFRLRGRSRPGSPPPPAVRADRRPAVGQRRQPVHPRRRGWVVRAGSAGEPEAAIRRAVAAGVVPGRRGAVGDPGRPGESGRAVRHRRRGWLTSYPASADPGTAARTTPEASAAGVALGPPVRLPARYVIFQATERGLLLAPVSQRPGTPADELWNPADPKASRTFDAVIAASATRSRGRRRARRRAECGCSTLPPARSSAVELPAGTFAEGARHSARAAPSWPCR